MFSVNLDAQTGVGMSWHQWEQLLRERVLRCRRPAIPAEINWRLWGDMYNWFRTIVAVPATGPMQQLERFLLFRTGLYGWARERWLESTEGVRPPDYPDLDYQVNPWELFFPEGDLVKRYIQEELPGMAKVWDNRGPGLLETMLGVGPVVDVGRGFFSVSLHTLATMTPYDPTAVSGAGRSGTQPLPHYMRHGWRGERARMRPRWPPGKLGELLQGWIRRNWRNLISEILHYIING